MNKEQGIYIRALKFASNRDTFTIQQLFEHVELNDEQQWRLAVQISNKEIFYHSRMHYLQEWQKGEVIDLSMSVEDEFRLLEYTELSEARASSKRATVFATAALIVSVVATISSTWFSYQSSNSEINYPFDINKNLNTLLSTTNYMAGELCREHPTNQSTQATAKASAD
jgi:hypothetical protein